MFLKRYFIRLRHFMGPNVEKTESLNKRAQIVYNQVSVSKQRKERVSIHYFCKEMIDVIL